MNKTRTDTTQKNETKAGYFGHERLEVYRVARETVAVLAGRKSGFAGSGWLFNQAIRAAGSVVLNIAEGASLRSRPAKRRHYAIALGSCGEVAAALDVAQAMGILGLIEADSLNRRVGQMLARLTQ